MSFNEVLRRRFSVDAIINSDRNGIICRFLKACRDCRMLLPAQTKSSPILASLISYAPYMYNWLKSLETDITEASADPSIQVIV